MRGPDKIAVGLAVAAAVVVVYIQFGVLAPRAAETVASMEEPAYTGTGLDHELVTFSDEDLEAAARIPGSTPTEERLKAAAARLEATRATSENAPEDDGMLTADPALLL